MENGYLNSLGEVHYEVLKETIEVNPTKGLLIQDLSKLTRFYIYRNQMNIKVPNGVLTQVTVMFLKAKDIEFELRKNKEGYYISGITLKNSRVRNLVETLTYGLTYNSETREESEKLYNQIFKNEKEKEEK